MIAAMTASRAVSDSAGSRRFWGKAISVSLVPRRASRSPPAFASGVRKCSDQPSWPEHYPGDKRPAEQIGLHALEITALSLPLRPGSLARFAPVSETWLVGGWWRGR